MATGSRPVADRRAVNGPPYVVDALSVLDGGAAGLPPGPVVIDDPTGDQVAVGVAEWLAAEGRTVTLVSPDPVVGTLLARTGDLAAANVRLQRAGVHRQLRSLIKKRADGHVEVEDAWTGAPARLEAAAVVDCGHRLPEDALYRRARGPRHPPGRRLRGPPHHPGSGPRGAEGSRRAARRPGPTGRRRVMSGGGRYRNLFSPLRIGSLTVRNRIVFSAHLTNYATQDGLPSEQHAAYYAARAAGGAGLIITEEHSTHPTDWPYEKLIHGFHPEVIPGYRLITDAVHAHDVPILAQINHNGGQASSMYTRLPVWAPSAVPDPLFREVPKEVEAHEIAEIVEGYALVAEHCMRGGFDGIELQCSHSSIVRGFLSPATNLRTDLYGGTLANRARLLLEIVAAVREARGAEAALGCAPLRRRAHRGWNHDRRCRRGGPHGRSERAGRLHQHVDRRGHRHPLHDRSEHADTPGVRHVYSERHPGGRRPPGRGRGAVQGPFAGGTGAGGRASATSSGSSEVRSPTPTSRPRPVPVTPRPSAPACPATRNAWAAWDSTAGWVASRIPGRAGKPSSWPTRFLGEKG